MSRVKKVPATVQLLLTRLQNYDEEVREQAWKGIVKLGAPEEPLVEKCEEQLHHENWFVREAGVMALAHCVDVDSGLAAAAAIEQHLDSDQYHLRHCANQTLLQIEGRVRVKVDSLKQTRADADTISNATASAERAAEMLIERLKHENPKVRQTALDTLSRMGHLCVPYAKTICALVTDPNLSVRNELVRAIGRLGALLVHGVGVLAEAIGHDEEKMRRSAARALLELAQPCGPEVAEAVLAPLESENRVTRIAALDLFAALGPLSAPHGKELAGHLEEVDAGVRLSTVRALVAAGKAMQTHQAAIKKRTKHENADIVRAAVQTLRGLASVAPKVAKAAFKDLEEEPDSATRMIAIQILAGAGHNAATTRMLEVITKCLEDKDWHLRRCAIEALADLEEHAESCAGDVAKRLLHHDPDVRRAGAETLGRMGLHAGGFGHRVEGLLDTEEDEDVKNTCAAACAMLYAAGMEHGR